MVHMRRARRLYRETPFQLGVEMGLFAPDATIFELILALCPWARWNIDHPPVGLKVFLDVREDLTVFSSFHERKPQQVGSLDKFEVYPAVYYAINRAYISCACIACLRWSVPFDPAQIRRQLLRNRIPPGERDRRYALLANQQLQLLLGRKCDTEVFRRMAISTLKAARNSSVWRSSSNWGHW
jgi:hypothetical protein